MTQQNQQPTDQEVRETVARILASRGFSSSPRLGDFLRFVAEETLAGRSDELKEYVIGTSVYRKDPNYNPSTDSTVRTEASRLRTRLQTYYEEEGATEKVRIQMPKGAYSLKWNTGPAPAAAAPAPPPDGSGADSHRRGFGRNLQGGPAVVDSGFGGSGDHGRGAVVDSGGRGADGGGRVEEPAADVAGGRRV